MHTGETVYALREGWLENFYLYIRLAGQKLYINRQNDAYNAGWRGLYQKIKCIFEKSFLSLNNAGWREALYQKTKCILDRR